MEPATPPTPNTPEYPRPPKIRRVTDISLEAEQTYICVSPPRLRRGDFTKSNFSDEKREREDEYDIYGRNITEQKRRQNAVSWVRVKYGRQKF